MRKKKQQIGKTKKQRQTAKEERILKKQLDILDDRMDVLSRVLRFREFLCSGFDPVITDVEIVVMFADVRGFTQYCRSLQQEMQDRKIQNFLSTYVKVFNEGLLEWMIRNTDNNFCKIDPEMSEIEKFIIPSIYKNLEDGLIMAWEIPAGMGMDLQGRLTQETLMLTDSYDGRFAHHFYNLNPVELDSYSKEVEKLRLGFGVAKGHAWRLDFGHSIDYAGSVINLASRLESYARPEGVVAMYDVSPWFFDQHGKEKIGLHR